MSIAYGTNSIITPWKNPGDAQTPNAGGSRGIDAERRKTFDDLLFAATIQNRQETASVVATPPDREEIQRLLQLMKLDMYNNLLLLDSGQSGTDNRFSEMLTATVTSLRRQGNDATSSRNGHSGFGENVHRDVGEIDDLIQKAADRYQVDAALIKGVVRAESNFNTAATSPKGAMGLMQLMPRTAQDLGVTKPYEPEDNVMGGTRYLKMLLDRYDGNVSLSLAAYNWGMGNVEKHPDRMPAETKSYVAKVISFYNDEKV